MIKNPLNPGILLKKYFGKLLLGLALMAILMPAGTGTAFASGSLPDEGTAVQQRVVTGTVTEPDGTPLPAVSVREKGTTNGTLSDAEGRYRIAITTSNPVLVFSFVGYATREINVGSQGTIDIELISGEVGLDEIVVIGYGTVKKRDLTGSDASISGEVMRDVPSSNISQALQGRISGVDMSQTSTKPGAAMQIRVRGTRSLNASNDPLIVIDGIPFAGSIGDINPGYIKSIDVLKDASATAIYGSRGANGVILITTNQGYAGQKAQVSYNSYVGMKNVFAQFPMMNGPEFVALRAARGQYTNGVDESNDQDINWQDLFYRTGMVTNHDLGVTGGTANGNYNFSVGYYKDQAVIPGQEYNRFSMRGTLDQQVGKFFRFGFITNNNYSINDGNNMGLYGVLSQSPILNPYNEDGSWKRVVKMPLDDQWTYSRETVEALGDQWIDRTKAYGAYNTLFGEVKIPGIQGLRYRINLGGNFRMSNGGSYTGEGVFSNNATTPSTATVSNSLTTNWAVENLLTYERTFAGRHQVNAVGMYSAEQTFYNRSQMSAKSIPADAFQYFNLGHASGEKTIDPNNQDYQVSGLMSWMGRAMYSYDNRYMMTATLRADASSRLAPGRKWHTYPAVSAGWNIKNESFMQNVTAIDMLKIRVGYGQTSNQSINPYQTLGRLSTRPYNFGPTTFSTGYYVSQLPNSNLGWEFSITWNYGIDISLLKNRISATVEYYVTNTKDILLSVSLPPTSGVSSYMANIGETQNKGLEFSVDGVIINSPGGFTWEAGVNVYANRNKLIALASGQQRDEGNSWFVGYPIDVIFDYEKIGLWQEGDPYLSILEPGGNVGMIKVKYTGDYNTDGTPVRQIGAADRQITSLEPNFMGGFNTRLSYKGLDLTAVGVFKSGGILISTLYDGSGYLNLMTGRRGNVKVDYWTPTNTDAKYPNPAGVLSGDNMKYANTLGLFDASYLKIRTVTLGYNLAGVNFIRNAGISKLRLYVTAQNPLVMFSPYHKESGMDPETNSYGNENAATTGTYQRRLLTIGTNTPSTRNYLIGIDLTF